MENLCSVLSRNGRRIVMELVHKNEQTLICIMNLSSKEQHVVFIICPRILMTDCSRKITSHHITKITKL